MKPIYLFLIIVIICTAAITAYAESHTHIKQRSAFFNDELMERVHRNVAQVPWAESIKKQKVQAAKPWMAMKDEQLWDLSGILQNVIGRLEALHERLAYNYFIHTAPLGAPALGHYHWHLEILPRLTTTAGFEWGAGYYINPMLPEHAAEDLRAQEVPGCRAKTASFPTGKAG